MILDGEYYTLDFDSIKGNLINVFTEYCGEKYRKVITDRINNINYIPDIYCGEVIDYYNQYIGRYAEEIQKEFFRNTDIRPTNKRKAVVFDADEGSRLLISCLQRKDIDGDRLLSAEGRQYVNECRDMCCEAFGISKSDPDRYDKILTLAKKLEECYDYVCSKHKCDVINDVRNFKRNKVTNTRDMLLYLHDSNYINLNDHDLELLEDPNFSISDIGNLDVNGLIFSGSIEVPGSFSAFTTDNIKRLVSQDHQEQAEGMLDVLRWIYRNTGYTIDTLSLTPEELLDALYSEEDFAPELINKIGNEFKYQTERYPQLILNSQTADMIEKTRQAYCNYLYNGCRMTNDFEVPYCMNPEYIDDDPKSPSPDLHMNESQVYNNLEELFNVLIHEVSHCMGFDVGKYTADGKRVISRCGLFNFVYKSNKFGNIVYDKDVSKDTALESIEENINERISDELTKLYLSKYPNPFEPNDIEYSEATDGTSLYNFWDFMLIKFYNNFKDEIIKHKMDLSYEIFYDGSKAYMSRKEEKFGDVINKINRVIRPNTFAKSGDLDYHKLVRLGELIEQFRQDTLPELMEIDGINGKNMIIKLKESGNKGLLLRIKAYCKRANAIVDDMILDREKLRLSRMKSETKASNKQSRDMFNQVLNKNKKNQSTVSQDKTEMEN